MLRDWELLKLLNSLGRSDTTVPPAIEGHALRELEGGLLAVMTERVPQIADMMSRPGLRSEIMLLPEYS